MSQDRLSGDSLPMTHELLASMLGVRRESVTQAAQLLQAEGAIQYRRGHITLVNRELMEARVSDGYAVLKKEYKRLLPMEPQMPVAGTLRTNAAVKGRDLAEREAVQFRMS